MALEEYNKKRDFKTTNEPKGIKVKQSAHPKFVVQRHESRRLHFDLRLEIDGVLKSWAVPKGPSLNPEDKRLAVQTEDHPMKYLTFEGIITKGNYGAGEMRIWDHGTFSSVPDSENLLDMLEKGDLKLNFSGSKLKGNFALVRTNYKSQKTNWLLIKKSDEFAIDLEYDANRHVDSPKISVGKKPKAVELDQLIQPMLASNNPNLRFPTSGRWVYEIKWDGYRILSNFDGKTVSLYSRNGISYATKFPKLVSSLSQLQKSAILDGEIVALDKAGKPQFQWLQHYQENPRGDLVYMVFDLLYLDGHSIVHFPLEQRRELLEVLIEDLPQIRLSGQISSSGKAFFEEAKQLGLEGIMAKKANSLYFPGIRSEDWLKFKSKNSVDALICGYTVSDKRPFGSLILGSIQENGLEYIGNCGTGFSSKDQQELMTKFNPLIQKNSPFEKPISLAGRKPVWLKPQLIGEVIFAEWTEQGLLRQPAFKGLKTDASPMKITKNISEKPNSDSKSNSGGVLELDGISVSVSNLEKELWPNEGITKYDLIDYYLKVEKHILPFLIDRPQNLHRHPNGILADSFYQKDTPETYPDWIQTTPVHSESSAKTIDYLLCQNEASLIYMANLACIEINPWNSRLGSLDRPDYLVIDLDPSPTNSFTEVVEVAQAFHELLDKLSIKSHCKTSGSSGLHIYLPMGAQYSYEEVREFCKILCTIIQHQLPSLTTMERSLKSRKGRIYLDYLQNRSGQTLASVYCVRPKPGAPVSTPLLWKEVNAELDKDAFNIFTMEERIKVHPTLFTEVLGKAVEIEKALERLEEI